MLHTDLCDLLGIEFPVIQVNGSRIRPRGWWVFRVRIEAKCGSDTATFNIVWN